MASFNPLKTMSFTKWFAIMDYVASLGFNQTKLGADITSVADSTILKSHERIGLTAIKSLDNGKSITHAMGWDMEINTNPGGRYGSTTTMPNMTVRASSWNSTTWSRPNSPRPTIPYTPAVKMGNMGTTYSEFGQGSRQNQMSLQSSIFFALGEWFDGVQGQLSTPSMFQTIDMKDPKTNSDYGVLARPLKLITPFENAFDHLGLPKKLLKQLIDPNKGLLAKSNNEMHQGAAKLWKFNTPYTFATHLACAQGKADRAADRKLYLNYFYNQNKYLEDLSDPDRSSKYSGPRPFRYFGYPQSSILAAKSYPTASLSTATGQVSIPDSIDAYYYSDNGSTPQWQTIADPSALLFFKKPAATKGKDATPLWMIRSLSQYGSAKKVSSRMHVGPLTKPKQPKQPKVIFPSLKSTTSPDYATLGFWAKGQSSPDEFKSIITAVADDISPTMASLLGAAPQGVTPVKPKKPGKPKPVQQLTAVTGKKPTKPKREFSPTGVKITITDFHKSETFLMGQSWLVLNITPDQKIYNKIMKDWEKVERGYSKAKRRVTPPTNYIKQYPKIVQLAFKAGSALLINTNGVTKPEWKEYKWDRDKDVVTVGRDSRFSFIDNDPLKGMSFALYTNMGNIDIKMTYDKATQQTVTTIDKWFKLGNGATEMKVEVGPAKDSMILPINLMTEERSPDISSHMLIDTNVSWTYYQRTLASIPPKELTTDSYPDAWTLFTSEIEIDYFNADSLAKKHPLMFQPIPFDQSTAKEIDLTKEYIELELFVENNTDTYTGFDYSLNNFHSEKIVFPCDERYLELESITTDPTTGETTTELITPAGVLKASGSIAGIWVSKEGDQVKIEFKSGETIIMPDEVNRGFSAIEIRNQQKLTGLITVLNTKKYPKGTGAAELPVEKMMSRTVKNIPSIGYTRMIYEDSAGQEKLSGTGSLIYEDVDKNINIILPHPDPDLGLVKFKLVWKEGV